MSSAGSESGAHLSNKSPPSSSPPGASKEHQKSSSPPASPNKEDQESSSNRKMAVPRSTSSKAPSRPSSGPEKDTPQHGSPIRGTSNGGEAGSRSPSPRASHRPSPGPEKDATQHDTSNAAAFTAVNVKPAGHQTTGGKGPANPHAAGRQTTGGKGPVKAKAPRHRTTGGKGPANLNAAGHPSTGGKSIEQLKKLGLIDDTREPKNLASAKTLVDLQECAKDRGLPTAGTRSELNERIILNELGLQTDKHRRRLSILLDLSQADLKARLNALNAPSKDKAKVDLARQALKAEEKMGGYPCLEGDEGFGSGEKDAPSAVGKKLTPRTSGPSGKLPTPPEQGVKRKRDDDDASTDESEGKVLKHIRFGESAGSNADEEARFQEPTPPIIPKAKPYKIPKRQPNDVPRVNGVDKVLKRKRVEEDQSSTDDDNNSSKRPKHKLSASNLKALQESAAIKEDLAKAINDEMKKDCNNHIVFDDKLDTRILLEHKPKSIAVFNAITRILIGQARADDVAVVQEHRLTLPNFAIFSDPEKTFEPKDIDDQNWLSMQKHWEHKERDARRLMEDAYEGPTVAVNSQVLHKGSAQARAGTGQPPGDTSRPILSTEMDAARLRGLKLFYENLDEPEADEQFTKEQKLQEREMEYFTMKKRGIWVGEREFVKIREHGHW